MWLKAIPRMLSRAEAGVETAGEQVEGRHRAEAWMGHAAKSCMWRKRFLLEERLAGLEERSRCRNAREGLFPPELVVQVARWLVNCRPLMVSRCRDVGAWPCLGMEVRAIPIARSVALAPCGCDLALKVYYGYHLKGLRRVLQ